MVLHELFVNPNQLIIVGLNQLWSLMLNGAYLMIP